MAAIVVMACLAVTSGSVRVAGAEAPTVAVSVSPTTGLADGQEITVTGTGTMPPSMVGAVVCLAGETECGSRVDSEEATADGFVLTGRVRALVPTEDALVDCRTSPCEVVVWAWDYEAEAEWELARVPVVFDPDAPLLDPPTVVVDPDVDLVEGQTVVVTGAGHVPMGSVWIEQCPVGDDVGNRCRSMGFTSADGDGRFTRSVAVRATLPGDIWGTGERVDCRNPATPCQVVTASSWGAAATPITFDPESPASPGPTIVVSPATDIVDGATVTVTGNGFTPDDMVDLQLCAVATSRCDITTDQYIESQDDGTFVTEMVLHHDIADHNGFVDCGAPPGCEVRARDWAQYEVARAPVSFRPATEHAVRYLDRVFPEVEVIRGVVYRRTTDVDGNDVELALDIYLPVGDTVAERPVAMWMFGGWFMFGDREQLAAYAMDSARRGYVGVAIDYRIRPGMDLADVIDAAADAEVDARAAVDWLKANADEYRLDPDAIVAGGVSAGAVLAWNLAYGADDLYPGPSPIAAAVPISGVPFSGPEAGVPPVISFHAVDDGVLPIGPGRETCALAAGVDALCQLVEMPDGGHYIAQSHARQIMSTTYAFLAEHVLRPLGYFAAVPRPPVRPGPYPGGSGTTQTTSTSTSTTATTGVPTTRPVPPPTTAPPRPTTSAPGPSTPPRAGGSGGGVVPDATTAEPVRARPQFTG